MKKFFKNVLFALVALLMVIPLWNAVDAQAATKSSLSETKKTIGIGTYGEDGGYFHKTKTKYCLSVNNVQKGATYTFESNNKKVVTVKKSGTKGYLTGVTAGSATVTVKQTLKGKTVTVGKCKVTVKKASVSATENASETLGMGDNIQIGGAERDSICYIKYLNPAATYTYKSNDSNLKMTQVKADAEWAMGKGYFCYAQKYTAKKPGTYTVTLQEKYRGKTRTVGKFKVIIHDTIIQDSLEICTGEQTELGRLVQYYMGNYVAETDDESDSILKAVEKDGVYYLEGVSEGEIEVKFYYSDANMQKRDYIGSCIVKVTEVKVKDIQAKETFRTYVGEYGYFEDLFSLITDPEDKPYYGNIEFTSSDDNIIEINEDYFNVVGEGEVTLTAKAGEITKAVEVTVVSKDEYYDYEE